MTPTPADLPDRAAIEAHQLRKLRELVEALLAANPFYAAKLRAAGVETCPDSLHDFCSTVPFTSKAELIDDQTRNPPFGSNLTYPVEEYNRFHQTSGTSGKPMRWLDTRESWDWVVGCWTRILQAAGVGRHDRVFFPFSFGPFLGFWGAFDAAARLGCLVIPGGGMRSTARLRTLLDNQVTALCTTPTYAMHLAEVAAEENIDLSAGKVRTIIVAGEPGGSIPATRLHIERLWGGARVFDHHGMTEIGPVTYECPQRRGVLHIMEASYLPEVLDWTSLQPVGPGGRGELVLTNLGRVGSPILRYRTGDIVQRAALIDQDDRCLCRSREMALEGGILGRSDDMVVLRGVNLYPSAVEQVVRSSGGVAEFRVEIYTERALTEMSIQIEPAAGEDAAGLSHRVAAALHYAFGLRVAVSTVPAGTLPRFEAKAKRWVHR
ncbi:MAG TPA: AMP-binding protein [Candidatus Acidoferrales bacterium]|jgi:phenylacetate-CoA ligase|nr:AMP-binding protein [Candidatus Acidoferrales bacterium]